MHVANLVFFKLSGKVKIHYLCLIKEIKASEQKLDSFVRIFPRRNKVLEL